ncbi:unnamed protein product [Anisakis simplex]|uniref:Pre-mRNA-splicing factor SYF1 n=1 Tax=Anisakis simplex TaxID=6269 RepID=A0A0M3JC29_ANISI|nr:unnamed protein product [Anisakis simplex]
MPILEPIEANTSAPSTTTSSGQQQSVTSGAKSGIVAENTPDSASATKTTSVHLEDEDIGFEENILRNPYSLRCWVRYIEHKKKCKAPLKQINMVYERALKELPGSYKLW